MNALPLIAALLCAFGGTSAPGARHDQTASEVKQQQHPNSRRGINFKPQKLRLHEAHLALELRWGFNLPEGELASGVLEGKYVLNEVDSAQGTQRRYHYGGNAALGISDAQGSRFLNLDALGSPTQETSASTGVVSKVRQTDAWGRYRNGTAPGAADAKYGFTGHQFDVESGLTYARARYYDAETGRMLSRDLVDGDVNNAPSLHAYAYGYFNPLRYTDPDGLCGVGLFTDFTGCIAEDARSAYNAVAEQFPSTDQPVGPQPDGKVSSSTLAAPALAAYQYPTADEQARGNWYASMDPSVVPTSGDAADIRDAEYARLNRIAVEQSMSTVKTGAEMYLKHVAVPYLAAEGTLGLVRFGAPVVGRAVARDLAAGGGKTTEMVAVEGRTTAGTVLKEAKPPPPPPAPPSGGGVPPGGGGGSKPSLAEPDPIHVWEGEGGALPSGPQAARSSVPEDANWVRGANKSAKKFERQMNQRGWTPEQITEAIQKGERLPAENLVNKGNSATRYVHPETGRSVVRDDVTKEVIHVGGDGFKY